MSEILVIRIKKRTLLILSIILLIVVGFFLIWYFERGKKRKIEYDIRMKEHNQVVEEAKEYAMRQHIKHVDMGEKYHKYCGMCNGSW